MSSYNVSRQPSHLIEGWHAKLISVLGTVKELVVDQRAERGIVNVIHIQRIEGKQKIRHSPKPFLELEL